MNKDFLKWLEKQDYVWFDTSSNRKWGLYCTRSHAYVIWHWYEIIKLYEQKLSRMA
jgi:hypothetical protein